MRNLSKRNHQLKVGILHLVRREKIRGATEIQVPDLKADLQELSQRLGMNADMVLMTRGSFCQNQSNLKCQKE
ncbi:hypothetical protein H8959_004850, partial [Pygathrix nigripes]